MSKEARKTKTEDAKSKQSSSERKKESQKEKEEPIKSTKDENSTEIVKPKYGQLVTFPYQRIWSRCVLILGVLLIVWYKSKQGKEVCLARQKEELAIRTQKIVCSDTYKAEVNQYPGCVPEQCVRVVTDTLIPLTYVDALLSIATNGMNLGGSDDGASILDLHSGALSKGKNFVNIYKLEAAKNVFKQTNLEIYKIVKIKVQHEIAHRFGVKADSIYLTKPTFFSRLRNVSAKTIHNEYWHPHVDKEVYQSFHYTSLLYLNDYGRDFEGGRFIYIDKNNVNTTVEPKKGRVSMFTSGSENLHAVEKVTSGVRYALTLSFTCDENAAISNPSLKD